MLGPSGCGKSTLLRLIAGLIKTPTLHGRPHHLVPSDIAYMAQNDLLLPWLTTIDNILIGNKLRGGSTSIIDHAHHLLAQVGLTTLQKSILLHYQAGCVNEPLWQEP